MVRLDFPAYSLSAHIYFDHLLGMTTEGSAIWEVVGIVDRSRNHGSGEDKAVIGINRGMFFDAAVRRIFFNNPIGVKIPMKLEWVAVFYRVCIQAYYAYLSLSFTRVKFLEK